MIKKLLWFFFILALAGSISLAGGYYYSVVLHPGEQVKPQNIRNILGKESPVFYSDGSTRLGVFFDQAHRQYVSYDKIPVYFINSLVASEDNRFFSHFGFDVMGILRALVKNIQSGRVVQGGSTLTQQTAKNLFKRKDRSILAKLKELLFALRLEYHYSKEQIFEFYSNQFYVSGNGHGLGVAARYYFDKKVEELNLLECAYIAGSVKRPNYYNPFIKKSEETRQKALERGKVRTHYVLGKMRELGMISDYQYDIAKNSEIVFRKGQVGYSLDYVMEMVKDAVSSTEIVEAMEAHDITNIATSGVRIITTVKRTLQEKTLYELRHDLSRLDVRLRGYEREEVQEELAALDYKGDTTLKKGACLFGVVTKVNGDKFSIEVDLGKRFGMGTIQKKRLRRLVTARVRYHKHPWSEAKKKDYTEFFEQFKEGDKVWVSVKKVSEDGGQHLLELEKFPEINGAALVIKDGAIQAMAGGVENRFYNRAIYAKRTMGSSYKPFVFAAAMQLGWNGVDLLRNDRDLFVFQNRPYYPRPDHDSPHEYVSMSWAGVHSENVASIWLVSHLLDKLDFEELVEVAAKVDMAPRVLDKMQEPYSRFRARIRDKYGIVVNLDVLRKAAYQQAIKNVETDFLFVGRDLDYALVENMHYGQGFDIFQKEIDEQLKNKDPEKKLTKSEKAELIFRKSLLENNFLGLESLQREFHKKRGDLSLPDWAADAYFSSPPSQPVFNSEEEKELFEAQGQLFYDEKTKRYCFLRRKDATDSMISLRDEDIYRYLETLEEGQKNVFWQNVYLNNYISIESFSIVKKEVEREFVRLRKELPYSTKILSLVEDYRILVGLKYLINFARELGINSDLQPVLSFPLGSNVVTLQETLRMYEGLVKGEIVQTGSLEDEEEILLSIIDRIESEEGEILYKPERLKKRVLKPETSLAIGHVLENIVKYGTGRYADRNVKLLDRETGEDAKRLHNLGLSVPVLGKTGTANRYTNASFFGFLPGVSEGNQQLKIEDGYSVGVYVGFDDNKEMRKGLTKISGSAGALPIWSAIVNTIVQQEGYAKHLDAVDLSFYGLSLKRKDIGQFFVGVQPGMGGVVPQEGAQQIDSRNRYTPSILTFGKFNGQNEFLPEKQFSPYWRVKDGNEQEIFEREKNMLQ